MAHLAKICLKLYLIQYAIFAIWREIINIWWKILVESKYWSKLTSKLVSAEVLSAGLHLTRPVEGHRHGGHQVEVAAVLGVADLDGDGDVVVTEENWVVLSVHTNILTQAAPKENKISARSSQVE